MALSENGDTALIGGRFDSGIGAAWAFTRSGSTWSQQGPKLHPATLKKSSAGAQVALSADGNTALIGAPGGEVKPPASCISTSAGSTWTLVEPIAFKEGHVGGFSFALSADAKTAIMNVVEGNYKSGHRAVWSYTYTP